MADSEEKYNFDDDSNFDEEKVETHLETESTPQSVSRQDVSLWRKIRPTLHYYIIAVIAFFIAGYMMYNAYKELYPEKEKNKSQNLNFSQHASNSNVNSSNKIQPKKIIVDQSGNSVFLKDKNEGYMPSNNENQINATYTDKSNISLAQLNSSLKLINKRIDLLINEFNSIVINKNKNKNNSNINFENIKKTLASIGESQSKIKISINLMNRNIGKNNKNIILVSNAIDKINHEIKFMLASQYNHREKLSLRAIVTGRAWLVNRDGTTLTVTKGDDIPGYGHVINIDDKKEQVVMSSGYVFN